MIKLRIFIITVFFAILINSCANKDLESKSIAVNQELNQVSTIGNQVGNMPYDFVVVTTEGKAVRLYDFIENKKPIIVYFMATWCPYCAQDYSALSKVYKAYENNVTILSISLDLNEDLVTLREYKKKYPELQNTFFAQGQSEILVNYRVTKTTTKYAIGRNGKIIYAGFGVFDEQQWKILLEELSK